MITETRHVPLAKVVIEDDEIEAVVDVLRSGNLREGAQCRAFEEEFAGFTGARFALTASSGTAALHMAYQAILEEGDEVLVPAFTFFATASMVVAAGGVPVFCDIDPDTLTIDVGDARRRITSRTRAIAPVHLFGNAANVRAIHELSREYDLQIVWDAAQAHGTQFQSADVGRLPNIVCYSFYPSKNMTTGEGGMICTDSETVVERIKLLRSQGQARKYHHVALGYNLRMTDIQAAIGRGQLRKLPDWIVRRREHAEFLRGQLGHASDLQIQSEQPGSRHSYHQFSFLLSKSLDREAVIARIRAAGVECAVHYPVPLHRQPFFTGSDQPDLPVSEEVAARILSVPVHQYLSRDDLASVAKAVLGALV